MLDAPTLDALHILRSVRAGELILQCPVLDTSTTTLLTKAGATLSPNKQVFIQLAMPNSIRHTLSLWTNLKTRRQRQPFVHSLNPKPNLPNYNPTTFASSKIEPNAFSFVREKFNSLWKLESRLRRALARQRQRKAGQFGLPCKFALNLLYSCMPKMGSLLLKWKMRKNREKWMNTKRDRRQFRQNSKRNNSERLRLSVCNRRC